MDMLEFYIRVVKALDEIGVAYMIVGAFGGTIFGVTRATHDIDIVDGNLLQLINSSVITFAVRQTKVSIHIFP